MITSVGAVVLHALALGSAEAVVTMTAGFDKSVVLDAADEGIVTVTLTATATEGEALGDYCLVSNPKIYGPCEDAASCTVQKNLMASQGWVNQSGDYMVLNCGRDGVATFTTAGWADGGYTFYASSHDAAQVPGHGVAPIYHAKAWIGHNSGNPPGLNVDRALDKIREAVVAECAVLQTLIDQARSAGRDTAYPRAALAVVKRVLRFEWVKLQGFEHILGQPSKRVELPQIELEPSVDLRRCLGILHNTIADLKSGKELKVPTPSMKNLTIKGAHFYSGKDPVMLNGPLGWTHMWDDLDDVLELGFNVMDDEVAASATEFRAVMMKPGTWGEPEAFFHIARGYAPVKSAWKLLEAKGANIALLFNPNVCYMPDWVYQLYPETKYDKPSWYGKHIDGTFWGGYIYAPLESPNMRKLLETYYQGMIPLTRDEPRLVLYWLRNEPRYWSHTAMYLEQFRARLQEKYESVDALNTVWGTSFKTFAEVAWPEEDNKPAWYDWMNFHYDSVTEFFAWQRDQVKKMAPNAVTSNKPQSPFMWLASKNEDVGIDFEAQAELYEVVGFDSTQAFCDTTDIVKWHVEGGCMLLDFYKSVAPNKPLANLEQHQMPPGAAKDTPPLEYKQPGDVVSRFIQLTNWQQFLHGVSLNTFWFWFNKMDAGGHRPVVMQPTILYANSKSALDLRRLARYVARFPARSEIAIYFSKPSLFLDAPNYSPMLRQVYAGLYFLDTPIGFVTDKMLSKGIDKNIKLLVIPQAKYVTDEVYQAIEAYARSGRKLVMVDPSSLTYDEKNQARQIKSLLKLPNVSVQQTSQDAKQTWQSFDSLLDESGVARPVRVTDSAGRPVWKIESRTVQDGSRRLVYLINMNHETREVSLKSADAISLARDLITEESVSVDALLLKSFDVKFLEIE